MDGVIQILQLLTSFAGPIIVAWFTAKMNKITKDNAEIKRLEDEKKEREKKDLDDRLDGIAKRLDDIDKLTAGMSSSLGELTDVDETFSDRVDAIMKQQKLIGQYTHKLAQLVITVATGMRDQHLDGNITHAVDQYHEFEQKTLAGIMTETDS
ncbi:MAG: hypothetical protein NC489_08110 [Ruminococcus flavefaciens]|nr:hypothetical protein [Ruminococcus flavefaciens]